MHSKFEFKFSTRVYYTLEGGFSLCALNLKEDFRCMFEIWKKKRETILLGRDKFRKTDFDRVLEILGTILVVCFKLEEQFCLGTLNSKN